MPRRNFRFWTIRLTPWIAFLAIPLIANGVVWKALVVPQRSELKALQGARRLTELKPKLQELLAESRQLRLSWAETHVTEKDPQAVIQTIQRSAERHNVEMTKTRMLGQQTEKNLSTLPFDLKVTGRFSKLARWMSDIETEYGFRVDSWRLKRVSDRISELDIKVTVLLEGV